MLKTPSVTVQYPFVSRQISNLARAQLRLEMDACTVCMECENRCPMRAVKVSSLPPAENAENKEKKRIQQISVDYGLCTLCGICVDICEPRALQFQKADPPVRLRREDLVVGLIQNKVLPDIVRRY